METGLSLGTNQGDRLAHLCEARRRIGLIPGLVEKKKSAVYETEPIGVAEAFRHLTYLNAILIVESQVPAAELMKQLLAIETDMGRVRGDQPNVPRPIDIDILFIGDVEIKDAHLCVPHPRWAERSFVVKPLAEVCSELRVPGTACSVREQLLTLDDSGGVQLFSYDW